MFTIIICVFLFSISVQCQTWNSRACLVDHRVYYSTIMHEVFRQIEKDVKWCNMKMDNRGHDVNERLFKWHAIGTVNYTDGFVVSIEKIDLTNIGTSVVTSTVDGQNITIETVRGSVNLRELNVGFDVIANLEDSGAHRFTGTYSHILVVLLTSISRNMNTNELSSAASVSSTSAGNIRMIYRPANSITEMLSRSFRAADNSDSYRRWATETIGPRMLQVAKTMDFPAIRFDGNC